MSTARELPAMHFETADAWSAWLGEHHASSDGIRLEIAKKGSGAETVSYADALDIALCYGWIDGRKNKLDDAYWLQRFTPRRAASKWSQRNRARATELITSGRMQAAGLREVERAKSDGRWDAAHAASSNSSRCFTKERRSIRT